MQQPPKLVRERGPTIRKRESTSMSIGRPFFFFVFLFFFCFVFFCFVFFLFVFCFVLFCFLLFCFVCVFTKKQLPMDVDLLDALFTLPTDRLPARTGAAAERLVQYLGALESMFRTPDQRRGGSKIQK